MKRASSTARVSDAEIGTTSPETVSRVSAKGASRSEIEKALWPKQKHQRAPAKARIAEGIEFDSIPERKRYETLRQMQRAELITALEIQPLFTFEVNGVRLGRYTADFRYIDMETRETVVEDVKGFKRSKKTGKMLPLVNREFGLKCRLMRALYGIEVKIVG